MTQMTWTMLAMQLACGAHEFATVGKRPHMKVVKAARHRVAKLVERQGVDHLNDAKFAYFFSRVDAKTDLKLKQKELNVNC